MLLLPASHLCSGRATLDDAMRRRVAVGAFLHIVYDFLAPRARRGVSFGVSFKGYEQVAIPFSRVLERLLPRSAGPFGRLPDRFAAERLISAALLLLPVLVGVLAYNAWAAERSHRAAAENAVRDYAAFAAWQFNRQARTLLTSHLTFSVEPVRGITQALARGDFPGPEALLRNATACDCGFGGDAAFAFRVDLRRTGEARLVVTPGVSSAAREILLTRVGIAGLAPLRPQRTRRAPIALRRASRLQYETVDGTTLALAVAAVADTAGVPLAIYGLAADARHTATDFERDIVREGQPLLPPSLVGRQRSDIALAIRVASEDGGTIYETAHPVEARDFGAVDSVPASLGGLVTTVAVRAAIAPSLVIGGLPQSRVPMSLALVAASAIVALVAVAHLRRSRELARARNHFVANISHELRTPLAQISMFSETLLLERGRTPEERHHFLSVIFREARRLTNLVDGILRFSRGETAGNGISLEHRDITRDVADAVRDFKPLAGEATLRVEGPPSAWALADAGAMRQILLNLLDNAVKFGPPGQCVTVRIACEIDAVVVSVEDQGIGIAAQDRDRVLEPFVRIERSDSPRITGSGIGLALVRGLIEAHGGRLEVAAGPHGRGARISFSLVAASPALPSRGGDSHEVEGAAR